MAQILVVDDSSTMRGIVTTFLSNNGFEVVVAVDGVDGLLQLRQDPGIKLVLSDVNMPNMDGISFVKAVKAMPAYRFTPVIMLTTESAEAKKAEGQAAGAKAWVVKPFRPEVMLNAVQKLVLP